VPTLPSGVPISERIVRQVLADVAACDGVVSANRGHSVQVETLGHMDAVVEEADESPMDAPLGNVGWHDALLEVVASIKYVLNEDDTDTNVQPEAIRHKLQHRLMSAIYANRTIIETATSDRLAIQVDQVAREDAEIDDGVLWCGVRAYIHYRTPANELTTAAGVAEITE
jgi:hypothetical protein